ncbi:hypothetical protein NPX79_01000 [Spiroplasma endosymbiont of Anurida maritima]|uniref:ribosomal-protein-alanine N-acetyltransferase n=1 Tax=Spiroplasma endosymbiont of Anurida maritima TaxID=2967972 RepID=UPI0036D2B747
MTKISNADGLWCYLLFSKHINYLKRKYVDFIKMINDPNYICLRLNYEGYIIALKSGDDIEIIDLVVNISNQGTGSKILSLFTTDYIIKDQNIFLEVNEQNTKAIMFYKKNNFKEINIRKNYYNNKYDAIILKK